MLKFICECEDEEEVDKKEKELRKSGVDLFDINVFRYWGKDGKYHREVLVAIEG